MSEREELHMKTRAIAMWLKMRSAESPFVFTAAVDTLLLAAEELAKPGPLLTSATTVEILAELEARAVVTSR